jgi:hypothetical protein
MAAQPSCGGSHRFGYIVGHNQLKDLARLYRPRRHRGEKDVAPVVAKGLLHSQGHEDVPARRVDVVVEAAADFDIRDVVVLLDAAAEEGRAGGSGVVDAGLRPRPGATPCRNLFWARGENFPRQPGVSYFLSKNILGAQKQFLRPENPESPGGVPAVSPMKVYAMRADTVPVESCVTRFAHSAG